MSSDFPTQGRERQQHLAFPLLRKSLKDKEFNSLFSFQHGNFATKSQKKSSSLQNTNPFALWKPMVAFLSAHRSRCSNTQMLLSAPLDECLIIWNVELLIYLKLKCLFSTKQTRCLRWVLLTMSRELFHRHQKIDRICSFPRQWGMA